MAKQLVSPRDETVWPSLIGPVVVQGLGAAAIGVSIANYSHFNNPSQVAAWLLGEGPFLHPVKELEALKNEREGGPQLRHTPGISKDDPNPLVKLIDEHDLIEDGHVIVRAPGLPFVRKMDRNKTRVGLTVLSQ